MLTLSKAPLLGSFLSSQNHLHGRTGLLYAKAYARVVVGLVPNPLALGSLEPEV